MKTLLLLISAFALLTACGPSANFSGDSVRFKSLMDGETVEIIGDDQLDAIVIEDEGLTSEEEKTEEEITSIIIDDSEMFPDQPDENTEDSPKDRRRCKQRLVKQDKENKHDEMFTSPREIEEDSDLYEAIRCGKDNGKKVLVCHHPNGDASKRKTLCVGRPSLEAHLGIGKNGRSKKHVNYAGPCRDDDQDVDNSDDQ